MQSDHCKVRHKGGILRLWNRFIGMPDNRFTKQIFCWDFSNKYSWKRELARIFNKVGLRHLFRNKLSCRRRQIKTILFEVSTEMVKRNFV